MLAILQEMFNKSFCKIMHISFGKSEFCEEFSASVPFLFTVSTIWTGSEVENEVTRERER